MLSMPELKLTVEEGALICQKIKPEKSQKLLKANHQKEGLKMSSPLKDKVKIKC